MTPPPTPQPRGFHPQKPPHTRLLSAADVVLSILIFSVREITSVEQKRRNVVPLSGRNIVLDEEMHEVIVCPRCEVVTSSTSSTLRDDFVIPSLNVVGICTRIFSLLAPRVVHQSQEVTSFHLDKRESQTHTHAYTKIKLKGMREREKERHEACEGHEVMMKEKKASRLRRV